jgi:hypothetical protein
MFSVTFLCQKVLFSIKWINSALGKTIHCLIDLQIKLKWALNVWAAFRVTPGKVCFYFFVRVQDLPHIPKRMLDDLLQLKRLVGMLIVVLAISNFNFKDCQNNFYIKRAVF